MILLRPAMRAGLGFVCAEALLIAGCSTGGGGSPQLLPPDLRGRSMPAMSASYKYGTGVASSVLRDSDDPGGSTSVSTSPQGDSFSILVSETLDTGHVLNASLSVSLPPQGSSSAANLVYPTANASLSHMAFGEWMLPIDGGQEGGFFAFGAVTPGAAIPTTGSATYTGAFHAKAFGGSIFFVTATPIDGSFSATADFATRSVSVTASNPTYASYDFTGTLSYASGTNQLSGSFSTTSGYSGGAVARFFGPAAEELGGAFQLTRPPSCSLCIRDTYVGSFGAKR
jgi:hypothetical protein